MTTPLLHLIPTTAWRACLTAGAIAPSVAEFVHLSTTEQVALPAGRLFAGRSDLLLLALDPDRIGVPVRFEPGLPTDPAEMRFPHAYGAIPTSAVLAVVPYGPRPDGGFDAPRLPTLDAAGRQATMETSYLRRAATREIPVTGGITVRTDSIPASHRHNRLMVDGPVDAPTVVSDALRSLVGLEHHEVALFGEHHAGTAMALAGSGWSVEPVVGMAAAAGGVPSGRTEILTPAMMRPAWDAEWRRHAPQASEAEIAQLVDRHLVEEPVIDLRCLAVREHGVVVASAQLRIDGATADLDVVETVPAHRGRGHGDTLLADARALAAMAGCDLVTLTASADDWPSQWYSRRGFAKVNRSWSVSRTSTAN